MLKSFPIPLHTIPFLPTILASTTPCLVFYSLNFSPSLSEGDDYLRFSCGLFVLQWDDSEKKQDFLTDKKVHVSYTVDQQFDFEDN